MSSAPWANSRRFAWRAFALAAVLILFTATGRAQSYNWKPVVIKGGGFVTSIVPHPNAPGLIYARTDIGGAYRWNATNNSWIPLLDFAADANIYGTESLALDPADTNRLYIAASRGSPAVLLVSTNQGATFSQFTPPFALNGNVDGRSNGERMAVDPNLNSILFYGTRAAGLYKSSNSGATWSQVNSFPVTGTANGAGLVFVQFIQSSGTPGNPTPTIFVGVSQTGGTNLFRSTDAGATWKGVGFGAPTNEVPHHAVQDGLGNLYITCNDNCGPNNITTGTVWKISLSTLAAANITPPKNPYAQGGFAGISVDRQNPATVVVSTMDRWWAPAPTPAWDEIYRSTNGGTTWVEAGPFTLPDSSAAPWSAVRNPHWAGDVKIDPFDSGHAFFITGYGVISCTNLTDVDFGGTANWAFTSDNLEETVPLGLASPPSGPSLLSGVGDQGGFRHFDLDVSPPLADYFSTHRVTSYGIDFGELNPNVIVRLFGEAPYGAYSLDGGTTWNDFSSEPPTIGNGAGSIAVSADGSRFVWMPQNSAAYYSVNRGTNWIATTGGPTGTRVPSADRVNSSKFYICSGTRFYASVNGGATFSQTTTLPSNGGAPRTVFGREGDIWLPLNSAGLTHSTNSGTNFTAVPSVQQASYVSFGKASAGRSYPAIFISGTVTNVTGIFRSDDAGASWARVNDDQHQFGLSWIHSFCADPRVYGRVYFGTEGRGIVYGDIANAPAAPSVLVATAGDGQVGLNWSGSAGAAAYEIKRSLVSGGPYTAIATNSFLSFTNTGLNNGTRYYFVVTAVNVAGESAVSMEANARPVSLAPTQVSVALSASHQLQLSWPVDHTGWKLEAQTNTLARGLGTNWATLNGATSTNQFAMPTDFSNVSVFFRLVSP